MIGVWGLNTNSEYMAETVNDAQYDEDFREMANQALSPVAEAIADKYRPLFVGKTFDQKVDNRDEYGRGKTETVILTVNEVKGRYEYGSFYLTLKSSGSASWGPVEHKVRFHLKQVLAG
jgi:hypothetical protein